MGNVMYLVEAALRPLETRNGEQVRDMVRDLFYGKARQILTYQDTNTNQSVRKPTEEEFSHVIVAATEGKDLYDGLDEYFFADQVENFHGGREATREVSVVTFPPILQIQVQVRHAPLLAVMTVSTCFYFFYFFSACAIQLRETLCVQVQRVYPV